MNKTVNYQSLGLKDYKETWDYQESLFKQTIDIKINNRKNDTDLPTPNYLLVCQHPNVYTLGKSGDVAHLLLNEQELESKEIDFYKINRGGDITFHGDGQLVVYPIIDLENFFTDIHKYLRYLEEAVIKTLDHYGVKGKRIDGLTGVWITDDDGLRPRKICAMGVKSSRWVTMHGIALNVNTNLAYFEHIIPCGIDDKAVTSLAKELDKTLPIAEVQELLVNHIAETFAMEIKV